MKFKTKKYYKNQNALLINELGLNYTKIERLKDEIIKLNKNIEEMEKCLKTAENRVESDFEKYSKIIAKYSDDVTKKEKLRRKIAGKVGALTRENKTLKEKNEKLTQQLNDLEKEKKEHWVKRELPADKGRNTQKIRFKSGARESKIISQVLS